jgi:hypothetical protein
MGLLQDYPTSVQFEQAFPTIAPLDRGMREMLVEKCKDTSMGLAQLQRWGKTWNVSGTELKTLWGYRPKTGEPKQMVYELGVLLGVRGTKNAITKEMGSFIAKYNERYAKDMEEEVFLIKMKECVECARKMVGEAVIQVQRRRAAEKGAKGFEFFDEIFNHHFKIGPPHNTPEWDKLYNTFVSAQVGLKGMFRLSALDPIRENEGTMGMVYQTEVKDLAGCSKNKVVHKDEYDRTIVSGSIHIDYERFKTPAVEICGIKAPKVFVGAMILHEATHRWAYTNDKGGYLFEEEKYRAASQTEKLVNADCYALAALSILQKVVVKSVNDLVHFGD